MRYRFIILTLITVIGQSSCKKEDLEIGKACRTDKLISSWTIEEFDIPFDINEREIHFPSESTGYIAGYNGQILKTTDSGETWQKLNTGSSLHLLTVFFVNPEIGFVGGVGRENSLDEESGMGSPFFKTTDGGITWERNYFKGFSFRDLYFFDEENGIASC